MRHTALLLLSLVLVALASCGGDDQGSAPLAQPTVATTDSTVAPTSPPTTVAATTTSVPDDETSTTSGAAATTTTTTSLVPIEELELELESIASGFEAPVFAVSPPGDPRLFVVDQPGILWVIGEGDPAVFLDIRDEVTYGGERGLLGLAFAPDFDSTGRFYVNYTDNGSDTVVSEFTATDDGVDRATERIVLEVDQPANNHNGGMIAFGPDGYLWIGMGDGGGSNDRYGTGQDGQSLLGAMLRIDPSTDPYGIPADNPGADAGLAAEVWAIGLRNPWRFSFDGNDLWIGDVGQNQWEEIDVVDVTAGAGLNFGWPRFEGNNCYLGSSCDASDLVPAVYEYNHGDGCSVTGGFVYRGSAIPELDGHYFFGDYCSGWIRSLSPEGDALQWLESGTVSGLSSFGIDDSGEVYVTSLDGGVYRLARSGE